MRRYQERCLDEWYVLSAERCRGGGGGLRPIRLLLLVFVLGLVLPVAPVAGQRSLSWDETYPLFLQAQKVAILSSEVAGVVKATPFRPQDLVTEGQVVLQLDDAMIRMQLEAARLKLELNEVEQAKADVQYAFARDNLEIVQKLYNRMVGDIPVSSEKELKEAQQRKAVAELELKRTQMDGEALAIELRQYERTLEKYSIRAPWDGVLVPFSSVALKYLEGREYKQVEVGEMVQPGRYVMAMMKMDRLRLSMWLPVHLLERVQLGQRAEVYVQNGGDKPFEGTVIYKSPTVNPTSQFNVEVEFANPLRDDVDELPPGSFKYRFRDGMRARVVLPGLPGGSAGATDTMDGSETGL